MKKIKLKLWQAIELLSEHEGLIVTKTKKDGTQENESLIKGLLNENILFNTKYNLKKNVEVLKKEKEIFEEGRNSVIQEFLDPETNKIKEDEFEQANTKFQELANLEIEIELRTLKPEMLEFETEYSYPFTMEFLIEE